MSGSGLVDSHCHLQHYRGEELAAVLDRARERGVGGFLVPASRLAEAEELLALSEREPGVWCALGVHPHEASSWQEGDGERLAALLAHPRAVAVGECGLDFFYDHAPREVQEAVFRAQCEVAIDFGLPVVIHNRESNERMLEIVADPALARLTADFHSFAGGAAMAAPLLGPRFVFGISGMVTFPKAENVREVLPLLAPEQLLVETDTPYLAPVPYRGRRNEPAYVVEVAARLAAELGLEPSELARRTTANFFRFFAKAGI
ncbi:MAG: TatD family hydrolase [Thermoanaerobaculia bacterium]|nr:TatD family hydrolase [Thermoanaerobaculia bacterium]MCZ7651031.1 TatD family hydrolase [Thermoanaerobaculia bacterium]